MTTTAPLGTQDSTTTPSRGFRQVLREHRVFFAATGAVMLHIADDNFLQPNAGVTAGDHLVSGLVPLVPCAARRRRLPARARRVAGRDRARSSA